MERKLIFEEYYCPVKALFAGLPYFVGGVGLGILSNALPKNFRIMVAFPSLALVGLGLYNAYKSYENCTIPYEEPEEEDLEIEFIFPQENQSISRYMTCFQPHYKVYNVHRKKIHVRTKHILIYLDGNESWEQTCSYYVGPVCTVPSGFDFKDNEESKEYQDPCSWWPGGLFLMRPGRWEYIIQLYKDENMTEFLKSFVVRFNIV